jgi:hypothetical protein
MNTEMFGTTEGNIKHMMDNNIYVKTMGKQAGLLMLAMSMLSDAQHVMEHHHEGVTDDFARQYINRAKYVMSEVMEELYVR